LKNRIQAKFQALKRAKKKALIVFMTAGDPSLDKNLALALAFEKDGVDLLELGVPFSDPLADGPVIQASSQRALKRGTTLAKILSLSKAIRKKSEMPIALMSYANPIFHYGLSKFARDAKKSGVDGVIIPDLPPEEAVDWIKTLKNAVLLIDNGKITLL
jgi:tryptophan synthase alpha chain